MAKEFSLKGVISFLDDKASATVKAVDTQVQRLQKHTQRISRGFDQFNQGLATAGAAGVAVGAGFGAAVNTAADFEQQIARVNAIFGGLTTDQVEAAEQATKQLGATTEFTAKQAGQGLEFLALAGFEVEDALGVLPTILDTAAAGAMDLASASDIVTDSMSALGAAFDENESKSQRAIRLADMMALVQSKANTNISQLGEAIKFGGGTLTGFGVPLEHTIAALGKLADAGLKGSIGGTALQNMFNKLVKPSDKATAFMEKFGVTVEDLPLQNIPKLTAMFQKMLGTVANENERGALAVELFGLRGIKAYNALANAGEDATNTLVDQLTNATGTASKMANIQRATFLGQVKQFKSAAEAILIEVGNFFIKGEKTALPMIQSLVLAMQDVAQAFGIANTDIKNQAALLEKASPKMQALIKFAIGFREGIEEAFEVARNAFLSIKEFLRGILPESENNIQNIGKMVAKFSLLLAIVSPLAIGSTIFSFAISKVMGSFLGLFNILRGFMGIGLQVIGVVKNLTMVMAPAVFSAIKAGLLGVGRALMLLAANPIGAILSLIAAGVLLITHWDTVKETAIEVWTGIKNFIASIFEDMTGVMSIWNAVFAGEWRKAGEVAGEIVGNIALEVVNTFNGMFEQVSGVVTMLIDTVTGMWSGMMDWFSSLTFANVIHKVLIEPIEGAISAYNKFTKFFSGSSSFFEGFSSAFSGVFNGSEEEGDNKTRLADSVMDQGQQKQQTPKLRLVETPQVETRRVNEASAERENIKARSTAPTSQPNINVNQPPIEATINVSTQIDGNEIGRAVAKQQINNSERLGQSLSPKLRSRLGNNGTFAEQAG